MDAGALRGILECMSDGVAVANLAGEFVYFNAAAQELLGRGPTELPAAAWPSTFGAFQADQVTPFPAENLPLVRALRGESCTGIEQFIRNPAVPQGRFLSISSRPWLDADGKQVGAIAVFRDVTALKQAEAELQRATQLLETSQAQAGVGGWEVDVVHGTLYWTTQTYRIHELSPDEFKPDVASAIAFYAPEWQPVIRDAVQQAMEHGTPWDLELELITAKGRRIWVQAIGHVMKEHDRVVKIVGTFRDITGQRKTAETQAELLRRLNEAQHMAHVGSWDWDIASGEVWWSDETYRIFGVQRRAYVPSFEGNAAFIHPHDVVAYGERFARCLETGEDLDFDVRVNGGDGQQRMCKAQGKVTRTPDGKPTRFAGTLQDVTERRRLEQQLLQSQKMESIGRLAGGIAHDFNNMLTVILGFGHLELDHRPGGPQPDGNLEQILAAAERASGLTRQLLAFSRQQVLEPKVLDVAALVHDMEPMIRRLIGENIALRTVTTPGVGAVLADEGQLQQVLLNLAVNARDAMPECGHLTIEVTGIALTGMLTGTHVELAPGEYVVLAVSDTGSGMTAETKARLFEPFFTTKPIGRGTGLGLATCFGIVKQSKGDITVYSELGQGTTFKIYLPQVRAVPRKVTPAVLEPIAHRQGGRVLLVEDEDLVRAASRQMLVEHGFEVIEASNADDALEVLAAHPEPIALLLTDVVMPGRNGRALATDVQRLRPEIKVLYISGYTDNAIVHHHVLDEGVAFLAKPFTPDALVRKVREVLAGT